MPFRLRKGSGKKPYKIQRKRGGKWQTVGSSTSRRKAGISIGHRRRASGHK